MMFKKAIVRKPCPRIVNGLTSVDSGKPDYRLACIQHDKYIEALRSCSLEITILEEDNSFPDSVFIEDSALLTPYCAIVMNPGAVSRKGEAALIRPVLNEFYDHVESIKSPGTAEGGDIMAVGSHFYIGLSGRTNQAGAEQLTEILAQFGLTSSTIPLKEVLHLKTAVTYLENGYLLAAGEFLKKEEFTRYRIIGIEPGESYAANSLWINDRVIMPAGYPQTKKAVQIAGYEVIEVDMSEFRKLDGGVSCLSLRF